MQGCDKELAVSHLHDISTIDIPGRLCMVLGMHGCNLNCGYCQNRDLLMYTKSAEELAAIIAENGATRNISITGGEPTIQADALMSLLLVLRSNGIVDYISLDTNGTHPHVIQSFLPFLNRVAMDLKGPPDRMQEIAGSILIQPSVIARAIRLLENAAIEFEIRTVIQKGILTKVDVREMAEFLDIHRFTGTYVLVQYRAPDIMDKRLSPNELDLHNLIPKDKEYGFDFGIRSQTHGLVIIRKDRFI